MILYPNNKISIFRGDTYNTEVDVWIDVYIYEQSDEQDAINGVDGWQNELRMITVYSSLQIGDKIINQEGEHYITKKVKHRNSVVFDFYEIQIRNAYD
jgi:hypothetical protein